MSKKVDTELAKKRRKAAIRRQHRRIAHQELVKHGTPKAETMKRLSRERAAVMGHKARKARVKAFEREYRREHPSPAGAAYMHPGIRSLILQMPYHERMERARLSMARVLHEYKQPTVFSGTFSGDRESWDHEPYPDWQARTLRALAYQRGKYRKLEHHTEAQARAHVEIELVIDFLRQGSAQLIHGWLHDRQVAD